MSKKAMYDLRNMLCDELDELARKGDLGAGDLEIAHKLTATIKNIDKIEMMEDGGYSRDEDYSRRYPRDGDWQSGMRGAYDRDMSNARRGTHYVRGHYSRDGGIDNMKRQLQEMLDNADDESIRRAIQRCMDTIEG
uniref:Uncharacterized protein n=1 Tax=Siphoviridae sp. ctVCm11 TaxID=2826358 RepID=A0A8S5QM31_9CAUD|nr:MAG TPA: hypothetical protein [Siphoviridae sp. ctVCm11]